MGYGGQAENLFIVQRDYWHHEISGGLEGGSLRGDKRGALGWLGTDRQRSTGPELSVQMTPDVAGEENEGNGGSHPSG
jgi:hypothetical protein